MKTILEGLTGTGKSSTLAALHRLELAPDIVVPEEETFGNFWDELGRAPEPDAFLFRRLADILDRIVDERWSSFLLERFHLSYYALAPDWSYYDDIDRQLADLGVSTVLLVLDDAALRSRSLLRDEYDGTDWQGLAGHYGSEEKAIAALHDSQQRRVDALSRSRLPHVIIDTGAKDWDAYARRIAAISP